MIQATMGAPKGGLHFISSLQKKNFTHSKMSETSSV
jgi:hypothetical protein